MKKKVIGLSTLLLVLLLGLSTICYADSSRTWTEDEVKNLLYNYYVNLNNKSESDTLTFIESNESNIQTLVTFLNSQSIIVIYINQNYGLTFLGTRATNKVYYSNNRIGFNSSYTDSKGYYFKSNFDYNNRRLNDFNSYSADMSYYYTNSPIYDNTYNNVLYAAGYYPSTFFDNWYYGDVQNFNFTMNSYQSTQYVDLTFIGDDGLTYNYEDIPIYYKPNDTSEVYIGTLNNSELTTLINDNYAIIYYKNGTWYSKGIQSRNLNLYVNSSSYLNIIPSSDLLEYEYSQKARFSVRDCFYFYSIDNNISERAIALWYIGSDHTLISGDRIDPSTFNNYDDYDNNVNNMLDNIDDIDNIVAGTEPIADLLTDDEQVSGELAGLISGDANDIANRFGYSPIENPFVAVVVDITESLTDILLGSGDVSLNFGFGGRDYYVSSSKFVLPNNNLTSFIHLCCNAFVLWQLWKYGFKLYEWVNSGRLQNLVNETNGHQYFLF